MSESVDRLVGVVAALREHCAWTARLTHASLVEYLVEEAYETVEAVESGAPDSELRGELADVLLQVVLHAAIASERGAFDLDAVADALAAKMVRRNPHVFHADGSLRGQYPQSVDGIVVAWDRAKRTERPERRTPFEGLPRHLPALALADKALGRAERWDALHAADDGGARAAGPGGGAGEVPAGGTKGASGLPTEGPDAGVAPAGAGAAVVPLPAPATEEELGDALLAVVRGARERGLDAERALRGAVRRFAAAHGEGGPRGEAPGHAAQQNGPAGPATLG